MAGSFRYSRFFALVACAALAVASAASAAWTFVVRKVNTGIAWCIARLPRRKADWADHWHRVQAAPLVTMITMPKRRPTVSPRWRMCPSV